jgi:sir2 silent information regulator family NAD-dependent deacetylase
MTESITRIADALRAADCVLIGAGAGLSTSAGYDYAGTRFMTYSQIFTSDLV